jgi:virginiamycin B lyase
MSQTTPPARPRPLCAVYDPLLPLLSLRELSGEEEQAVLIHAATCDWCQSRLADYDLLGNALLRLAADQSSPEVPLMLGNYEDFMESDTPSHASQGASPPPSSSSRRTPTRFGGLLALVATILVAALAATLFASHGFFPKTPEVRPATVTATPSLRVSFSQFKIAARDSSSTGIVLGPDHALWFIDAGTNAIGRISSTGQIKEYRLSPSYRCDLHQAEIAVGPDGALWFVEDGYGSYKAAIGRITVEGTLSEFPLPHSTGSPLSITAGPDGNLWFTENSLGSIGRLTPSGQFSQFDITQSQISEPSTLPGPVDIATGPDGALWFTDVSSNAIGRITTSGEVKEYSIPTPASKVQGIVKGPDGGLWFTEKSAAKIGRISVQGAITEFAVPSGNAPLNITTGPDGALWFTEASPSQFSGGQVGRVTVAGAVTEFSLPSQYTMDPSYIVTGPDGALWFTNYADNAIGHISLQG